MECLGSSACFLRRKLFNSLEIQIFAFVNAFTILLCYGTMTSLKNDIFTLISNLFKEGKSTKF